MAFSIVIERRAIADVQQAIDYYDKQQIGLGRKFSTAFDLHIQSIAQNPFYQVRYKDYRALPMKKFPFLILFYISEADNSVFITAVFHASQHTDKLPE
jgi:toxin ParE1/3/4